MYMREWWIPSRASERIIAAVPTAAIRWKSPGTACAKTTQVDVGQRRAEKLCCMRWAGQVEQRHGTQQRNIGECKRRCVTCLQDKANTAGQQNSRAGCFSV